MPTLVLKSRLNHHFCRVATSMTMAETVYVTMEMASMACLVWLLECLHLGFK